MLSFVLYIYTYVANDKLVVTDNAIFSMYSLAYSVIDSSFKNSSNIFRALPDFSSLIPISEISLGFVSARPLFAF
jgi:hypothetical protein